MAVLTPTRPIRPGRRWSPLALVEALATPHGVDRYLELVNPMFTVRELRAQVTAVRRPTADSVTLTLRPTRQWRGFQAGQFVQVNVDIDGVRRTRCFSPAGSQHRADGRIELTVKAHAGGVVSQYLYRHAQPGLVVGLSQADGTFRMPTERPERVLFVSGGSGITPVMSMVRTLCDEGYTGDVAFLHYADTAHDVAYADELRALSAAHPNVRVAFVHTRTGDGDLVGFFGPAHLDAVAPWHAEAQTYLCGPPALMRSVREQYDSAGLADRLHSEAFQVAALAGDGDPADVTGTLAFARSGRSVDNTGATLLEQAESAGLSPEFGCRMGICFSCTSVRTSGCTRNVRTGETSNDPDTEVQLCISVPVGDVTLDI